MESILKTTTKPLSDSKTGNLWMIYGLSSTGKTTFCGTFPNLVMISFDDGAASIQDVQGGKIDFYDEDLVKKEPRLFDRMLYIIDNLIKQGKTDYTFAFDTFTVFVGELKSEILKDSKYDSMTKNMWGDLSSLVDIVIDKLVELSKLSRVVLTAHQTVEKATGVDDELIPEVSPSLSPASRRHMQGKVNYAIHTTILNKMDSDGVMKVVYGCHLGKNPYYWTKTQKPKNIELPEVVYWPTYKKIKKLLGGTKE